MEYTYYYYQTPRAKHGGFSNEFNDAQSFHGYPDVHAKPSGAGVAQVHSQGQLNPYFDTFIDNNKLVNSLFHHADAHAKPYGAGVVQVHSQAQLNSYFDACSDNNKLLVIEFTASWCGPCRFLDPTFKEMAADYTNVQFIKIDVDELLSVAQQFNAQTLPTFVLVKNGKEVDKVTGVKMDELLLKIKFYGN